MKLSYKTINPRAFVLNVRRQLKLLESLYGKKTITGFSVFVFLLALSGEQKLYGHHNAGSKVLSANASLHVQQVTVSGSVTDKDGEPLQGVSVRLKGGVKGTATDAEGAYRIEVNVNATLVFTNIGYVTQEVEVGNRTTVDVTLTSQSDELEEVVVTAYGLKQSKLSNVAAISTIENREIKQSPAASVSVGLAGRLPGLTAIQRGGEPGKENNILLIRGKGTFNTQAPLIIVDGIERSDFLNSMDPNEVESISILKDASSTALYGVRGANGVLIVTTKRGTSGAPVLNFSAEYALQNYTRVPQRLDAYNYAILHNEARFNSGQQPFYSEEAIEHWRKNDLPELYPNVNWFDEFTKDFSPQDRYNLNISGGTENLKYFINAGYLGQEGLWKTDQTEWNANTEMKRYNFRTNFDANLNKGLKASLQLGGYLEKQNNPAGHFGYTGNSTTLVLNSMLITPPGAYKNSLTPDGEVVYLPEIGHQPIYAVINRTGYVIEDRNNVTATFSLEQDLNFITTGLAVRGQFAFDSRGINNQKRQRDYAIYQPIINDADQSIDYELFRGNNTPLSPTELTSGFISNATTQFSLNYSRQFTAHKVNAIALYQQERKIINADLPYNYLSFAARAGYSFKDRYFTEINVGYNGSEQFEKGKRFGLFPAFSAGWRLSEEAWFSTEAVSDLKLRGSFGWVGNDRMINRRFLYLDDYANGVETFIGNRNITWETARKLNVGIDARLFKDFTIVADVFTERRDDILTTLQSTPEMFGNKPALPPLNIGVVENKGVELEIGYSNTKNRDFHFQVRGNVAYNKNRVVFADEPIRDETWSARYRMTGHMIGQPFGLIVQDYFKSDEDIQNSPSQTALGTPSKPGDFKYVDTNNDGVIDDRDEVAIGYPNEPLLNFGLAFSFSYKNVDFAGLLQGSALKSLYIHGQGAFYSNNTTLARYAGRWSPERYEANEPISYPRLSIQPNSNQRLNTFFLENASFLRLKTVELGYTFSESQLRAIGVGSLRVFVTGSNLFTWDNMREKDYDPEYMSGTNGVIHPIFKVYNAGVTVSF